MIEAREHDRPIWRANGAVSIRGVTACLFCLLLSLASLMDLTPASAQSNPSASAVRLQAAIEKEQVDGDLPAAIAIYQEIGADKSAPRELRSKALLRLAGCEDKLQHPATQIYKQILRDYPEEPAAKQAREHLALLNRRERLALPKTMTARKIEWSGLGFMGSGDTDGEHAIYSASDGNLYFSDLNGRNRHVIFHGEADLPPGHVGSFPSRDFSMVAIQVQDKPGQLPTLATIKSDGTGYRELLRDDPEGSLLGGSISGVIVNWSWDDRTVAVSTRTIGGVAHLMIIDLASGHRRELARIDSGRFWSTRFSPDGRFIAYEVIPDFRHVSTGKCRIFIKPVQGGEERLIYESADMDVATQYVPLKDWTADGRYIVFKDIRDGQSGLYLQPMKDGAPSGPATFVRFGDYVDGNITPSGSLVYQDRVTKPTQASAYFASFEPANHLGDWKTIDLHGGLDAHSHPWPSFSPDGTAIAYIATEEDPTRRDLILQDLSTGQQRVLYRSPTKNIGCQFSAHSARVFCTQDFRSESRTELISIAADSGAVEKMATFSGSRFILESPMDDRIFHFSGKRADLASGNRDEIVGSPILGWDLLTKEEKTLVPTVDKPYSEQPTPDGLWLVRSLDGNLSVRPISGGGWKTLVSDLKEDFKWTTTPDGHWIVYHALDEQNKHSLFRIPITGGTPERLGDFPSNEFLGSMIRMSPDGRRILASDVQSKQYDLWILENFEPPAKQ